MHNLQIIYIDGIFIYMEFISSLQTSLMIKVSLPMKPRG